MPGKYAWHAAKPHHCMFKTPQHLLDAANSYFKWVEENPLLEDRVFSNKGDITHAEVRKMRIMTVSALCRHIGISNNAWLKYRDYEDFSDAFDVINGIIYDQKLTGAAADMFNPMIIARCLRLKDHQDLSSADHSMTPAGFDVSSLSESALKEIAALDEKSSE